MDKYNVVHSDSTLNTAREAFEYGNQETFNNGNKATSDSPIVSTEFTNLTNLTNLSQNQLLIQLALNFVTKKSIIMQAKLLKIKALL
jgi:hypothetical protein